jgi:hypothetical protein
MYLLYRNSGKEYVYLADSAYREKGQGEDYFALTTIFRFDTYKTADKLLNDLYAGKKTPLI